MQATMYNASVTFDNRKYNMIAIWTRDMDHDILHILNESEVVKGVYDLVSVTTGTNWDFQDLDLTLRTDVANWFKNIGDEEYEEILDAIVYTECSHL